jgi:diaminopimelate epimerase
MKFNFYKYQAAGNDFIIVDDRLSSFPKDKASKINQLCNRHMGIGADGLILVQNSTEGDFKMIYFNSDGNQGSLCGNGGRCVFAFARSLNIVKNEGVFEACDGLHFASMKKDNLVSLDMNDVQNITKNGDSLFINTGSPHHLELVDDISKINVNDQGAAIRYGEPYLDLGTNVNYIEILNKDTLKIRTYERGVEKETLSCGTGAVAAGVGVHFMGLTKSTSINIHASGGILKTVFKPSLGRYSEIKLIGPAEFIFSGNFEIK